jgi:hypothetical protein
LLLLGRHSRAGPHGMRGFRSWNLRVFEVGVLLTGIRGFAGVDARQVHAGMTITWMFYCSL